MDSNDAFILHAFEPPTVFVWIGNDASSAERKIALNYGHRFITQAQGQQKASLVRVADGREPKAFRDALARAAQ